MAARGNGCPPGRSCAGRTWSWATGWGSRPRRCAHIRWPAPCPAAGRARSPRVPSSAATATVSTASRTSCGCAKPDGATPAWTKSSGGRPNRRSPGAVRSACAELPALVIAQVLFGLQQRCRLDGVKTKEAELRAFCNELRRQQVSTIGDHVLVADPKRQLPGGGQLADHPRRSRSVHPRQRGREGSVGSGRVRALRDAVVHRASARAGCGQRRSGGPPMTCPDGGSGPGGGPAAGWRCAITSGAVARLSESLRARPDRGEHPAALSRADMDGIPATGWPSWNRAGRSAATPGSGPAARSATCSPASGPWA